MHSNNSETDIVPKRPRPPAPPPSIAKPYAPSINKQENDIEEIRPVIKSEPRQMTDSQEEQAVDRYALTQEQDVEQYEEYVDYGGDYQAEEYGAQMGMDNTVNQGEQLTKKLVTYFDFIAMVYILAVK